MNCSLSTKKPEEPNPIAESLGMHDPPSHGRLRGLVARAFSTRVLARVEPLARGVARAFVDRAASAGEMDSCEELPLMLPGVVVANLLGLDRELLDRFRAWSVDLASIHPATPVERRPGILSSIGELERYLGSVVEER